MQIWLRLAAAVMVIGVAAPAGAQVASGVPVEQGERSVVPRCAVADDPAYGTTRENPIKVGGGAMTVVAREQQYLKALRGPAGQAVSFKRSGSLPGPDKTMLDLYVLTWEGQEQPFSIYIDAYRWETPKAPMGLVCGSAIGLNRPPADSFEITRKTTALAIKWGAANDVTPIPLSTKEGDRYGVAWDQFRQAALVSRAATKAGTPLDPENPPPGVGLQPLMLVAYPLTCGDRVVRPRAVFLTDANGGKAPTADQLQGDRLTKALPGVTVPEHSVGQQIRVPAARRTDLVVIQYDGPVCEGDAREITLPAEVTPARPVRQVPIVLVGNETPPDQNNPIRVIVVTDPEGRPQIIDYGGGPEEYLDRAIQAMSQWGLEPLKWNGAPVVVSLTIPVRTVSAPGTSRPAALSALSTVGFIRTQDMPTLPPAQCPVSADPAFGLSATTAIPVGGGTAEVVERARLYLVGLRGEKGQGLVIRRRADAPEQPAREVEVFEVARNGETKGTLFYFDATRWADIAAPQGFVCAGPMMLRPPR